MQQPNPRDLVPPLAPEDFWLELGPGSAFEGMECQNAALENGDVSPDGQLLGWQGAEKAPHKPMEEWDDVPPIDR